MARILLVDDEPAMRLTVRLLLTRRGYEVTEADGVTAARAALAADGFDLVISDLKMPDGDGLDVLAAAKEHTPETEVILLTAYGSVETAVEAMRRGAFYYVEKPFDADPMYVLIERALERRATKREVANLRRQVRERYEASGIVGRSREMQKVLEMVARVASTDATVLIQGESGTGKELVAKAIHHGSPRAASPFLAINCGALPESLLESELFGHVKGAFTGAMATHKGLFEEAIAGTIFLDEIGDTTPATQVKLLRVLQEKEVRRVGSATSVPVDVRVLAATNRDLAQMMREGAFRDDLFYRLSVIPLTIPPLRERRDDIPDLADHFITRYAEKTGKAVRGVAPDALAALLAYPWPGNVRELENVIERAVVLVVGDTIGMDDLPRHVATGTPLGPAPVLPKEMTLADLEKAQILDMMTRYGGNHSKVAEVLGIGRTTLWRKLKEYGISREG